MPVSLEEFRAALAAPPSDDEVNEAELVGARPGGMARASGRQCAAACARVPRRRDRNSRRRYSTSLASRP